MFGRSPISSLPIAAKSPDSMFVGVAAIPFLIALWRTKVDVSANITIAATAGPAENLYLATNFGGL